MAETHGLKMFRSKINAHFKEINKKYITLIIDYVLK